MQGTIRLVAISLAVVVLPSLFGGENSPPPANGLSESPSELSSLWAGLDSPDYAARRAATTGLEKLLESPDVRRDAKRQLRQVPWQTLSLDVRHRLAALGLLPTLGNGALSEQRPAVPDQDIDSLVKSLASDRYLDRAAALEQLQGAAQRSSSIEDTYPALKRAAADAALSIDVRLMLGPLLDASRYTWLANAKRGLRQPPSAAQIAGWIDVLAQVGESGAGAGADRNDARRHLVKRNAAERDLLDALTQEAAAARVQQAVEAALARDGLDDDAMARLRRLHEWARPGLAAEYWQRRGNLTVQYFIVGVPSQAPGAPRPTRFDRVTDDFAICASGNSLQPGEYPLGVAFPHPREQAAFFQLVSLPTARERVVYQYETALLDDGERLRAITERTLGPSLAKHRPLDDAQLWLLGQLDQPTVARLLSAYFAEVPDEPFDLSQLAPMLSDVSSVHRTACLMLALDGSHEVVAALVEAAENKRFMSLSIDEPQAMPWIAALAIAQRDPWEGVDRWLAGLIESTDRISFGHGANGEVGATAAATLLLRNGQQPHDYGLAAREPLTRSLHDRFEAPINADYRRRMFEDRMFKQLGITPHHFAGADDRAAVQAWWNGRQATPPIPSPAYPHSAPTFTARAARP